MNQPVLSICILNWNGKDFIRECIASVYNANLSISFEIILIDNNSTDGSAEMAVLSFPDIRFVKNPDNCGFAKGNNSAIKVSNGKYIVLLNPDTLVYPGTFDTMVAFMDRHEKAGICGPRLCHPETKKVETSARSFPTLMPLFWNLVYLDRVFPESRFWASYQRTWDIRVEPHVVDWVTGACLMIRRDAIDEIGLLDESIFMYCEDIDWCYRCKKAGSRIFYLPGVLIGHFRGQSSKQRQKIQKNALSVWGAQQYTRSIIYFYSKHYGFVKTILLRGMLVFTSFFKAFLWLAKGLVTFDFSSSFSRARSYISMIPVVFGKK